MSKHIIRIRPILLPALLFVGIMVLYALVDPLESAWMPKCPFYMISGWECPGCGSQRALHAILGGDIGGAWRANAFLFFIVPFILILALGELLREKVPRFHAWLNKGAVIYTVLAVTIAWGIIRNFLN